MDQNRSNPHDSPAVEAILQERTRQMEMGWSLEHDDTHDAHEWAYIIGHRVVELLAPETDSAYAEVVLVQIGAIALAAVQAAQRRRTITTTTVVNITDQVRPS